MHSTEREGEKELRRFYRERMVPVAERLRRDGVRLMPLAPDDAESWYVPYPPDTPEFVEFEGADVEAGLRSLWEREGLREMVGLAGPMGDLAAKLERPTPTGDSDVSPFVYAMF